MPQSLGALPTAQVECREYERHQLTLPGKLFVPGDMSEEDCTVVDLSAGGVGVLCSEPPPLEVFVVLYIQGFGRFEAVTTRLQNGILGLRFLCTQRKRDRLIKQLTAYLNEGVTVATRVRENPRASILPSLSAMRMNGRHVDCQVLDISPQGLSLKTEARPPINEFLKIGRVYVRVARHHENGIGVEFLNSSQITPVF